MSTSPWRHRTGGSGRGSRRSGRRSSQRTGPVCCTQRPGRRHSRFLFRAGDAPRSPPAPASVSARAAAGAAARAARSERPNSALQAGGHRFDPGTLHQEVAGNRGRTMALCEKVGSRQPSARAPYAHSGDRGARRARQISSGSSCVPSWAGGPRRRETARRSGTCRRQGARRTRDIGSAHRASDACARSSRRCRSSSSGA